MENVTFTDEGIQYKDYPVTPASFFPDGIVLWDEIKEADPDSWPSELRLLSGEVLFISSAKKEVFTAACLQHKTPLVQREDVWGLLLEPFLDTEFTKADQQRTIDRLQQHGFSEDEVTTIRKRTEKFLIPYNFYVLEWEHLGLLDLFVACGLTSNKRMLWINSLWRAKAKKKIYWWAINIANRPTNPSE